MYIASSVLKNLEKICLYEILLPNNLLKSLLNNLILYFFFSSVKDGQGDWSTEGCRLEKIIGDKAICHCNHLTNFALLFSSATDPPTDRIELTHKLVLEVITYVGCAMSLAGSALTLFTYSIFR